MMWSTHSRWIDPISRSGCPYRKSNPGILMMETAEDRATDNIPDPLGTARDRAGACKLDAEQDAL
jgi:hypothetical protein